MSDVTRILQAIEAGDQQAAGDLLPRVYDQLRRLAQQHLAGERAGHTLQATALVHEAYLRLVGDDAAVLQWANRAHFFHAAATAMRRILVEHARARGRLKRGGGRRRLALGDLQLGDDEQLAEMVALDESLRELERQDPQLARVVDLRFFAGLSVDEVAAALDVSARTVKREWSLARAWLFRALDADAAGGDA